MPESPLTVRLKRLDPRARLPHRASETASGLDLYACLPEGEPLQLGRDPVRVPTGIAIEFPFGVDCQIRPRSGLSARGVGVTLGTIDADYRGELQVTMYVFGSAAEFTISHGDRIAQLVFTWLAPVELIEVEMLSDTVRGAGGHGSTGLR
jgi:dUTP pyrophosphatase